MNLDEVSDGEINFKLWNLHAKIPEGHATICVYDYCNSWADMGPLIEKYGLSVHYSTNAMLKWHASSSCGDYGAFERKNPLRAAAICLIKKLEAEK